MLTGRIKRKKSPWWIAECAVVGAWTQGRSRKEAMAMLADCIETKINRAGIKVSVTEVGDVAADAFDVVIDANEPALLAAEVLKYQRGVHGLSLADVAKTLGAASRNAYASYEQGHREPSLSKFRELLKVVAPEMALLIGPRRLDAKPAPSKRRKRSAA